MLKKVEQELRILIGSRNPGVWVTTPEEKRLEGSVALVAESFKPAMQVMLWSCASGFQPLNFEADRDEMKEWRSKKEPDAALGFVMQRQERCIYVLRDFHHYIDVSNPANVDIVRGIRDICRALKAMPAAEARQSLRAIVFTSPEVSLPSQLTSDLAQIGWPLPDREEIDGLVTEVLSARPNLKLENGEREAVVDSALGLTLVEAENCFARSLAVEKTLDPTFIKEGKKSVIAKSGVAEWIDPVGGLDDIGGMEIFKDWAKLRRKAFSQKAREFGLPIPRGVLFVGPPGTGKSFATMALAIAWGFPLIRAGQLFGSLLGESENNLDRLIATVEAAAPCILQIDEIEKFYAGVGGSGDSDGGVGKRMFGRMLTWMQEKTASVFIAATSNDVSGLPPELMRKGRYEEIWFVDLPNVTERQAIFKVHLKKRGRNPDEFDLAALAKESEGFSGAEIEAMVVNGLYAAFDEGRDIRQADIVKACKETVPLSATAKEKIAELQRWSRGRARKVSAELVVDAQDVGSRFASLDGEDMN